MSRHSLSTRSAAKRAAHAVRSTAQRAAAATSHGIDDAIDTLASTRSRLPGGRTATVLVGVAAALAATALAVEW